MKYYLTLFLFVFISCNHVKNMLAIPCKTDMSVSTAMVSNTEIFGWVGIGSEFFNHTTMKRGYVLNISECGETKRSVFCPYDSLQEYIDMVKYEISIKDSVISVLPINIQK